MTARSNGGPTLRGTRYGDFSRSTFDPAKGYRSVLMQQGRVQVDADWNEQADLQRHSLVSAMADVLGTSGAPARWPGYRVDARVALEFSGAGAAVVADPAPLLFGERDEFTIEAAIRWAGVAGTLVDCLAGGRGTAGGYRFGIDDDGMLLFSRVCADPGGEDAFRVDVRATGALTTGRLTRVAAVCREGRVILYANARPVADASVPAALPIADGRVSIGASVDGEAPPFQGLVANLRVWAGVRSAAQLATVARAEEAPADQGAPAADQSGPDGLVAWWPFNEGRGRTAKDRVSGMTAALRGEDRPSWRLVDLDLGAGRFYVDGVACQLDHPVRLSGQPAAPGGAAVPSAPGGYLAYLEVWERTVSAIEDAVLLEEALGGLDTTVRSQVVAGVGVVALPADVDGAAVAGALGPDLDGLLDRAVAAEGSTTTGTLAARHDGEVLPGNFLYRVEVHRGGHTTDDGVLPDDVLVVAVDQAAAELTLAEPWPRDQLEVDIEIVAVDVSGAHVQTRHSIAAVVDDSGHRVRLGSDPSDLRDLSDARLRPVRSAPSFKWSRRNGAEMYPIAPAQRGATTVELSGALNGVPSLEPGDVVELATDQVTFGGPAAKLFRVASLRSASQVELDRPVPAGVTAGHHPFLRRWTTSETDDWGVPIEAGKWVELEDGIHVSFGSGAYRQGDYWWIPARQQPDPLSWPVEHGHPVALGPAGVERRRAPLAFLSLTDSEVHVRDLRGDIEPLVQRHAGPERRPAPPPPPPPPPEPPAPAVAAPAAPSLCLPPGFAVVGPAGASSAGFRPMGLRVVTRPAWSPPRPLALPAPVQGAALVAERLVIATTEELWSVDAAGATALTRFPEPRQQFTLFAVLGTVLVIGGHPLGVRADGRVLAYDLEHDTWSERRPLPRAVSRPAVTELAGLVHIVGGLPPGTSVGGSRDHQVYDAGGDRWTAGVPLPEAMAPAAAGTIDGRVHVVGSAGKRLGRRDGAAHLAFEPGQSQWVAEEPLPGGRTGVGTVTNAEGSLWVPASPPHRPAAVVLLEFRSETGTWEAVPAPPGSLTGIVVASGATGPQVIGTAAGQQVLYQLDDQGWELFVPEGEHA